MIDNMIYKKIAEKMEGAEYPKGLSHEKINEVSEYFKQNFGSYLPNGYTEFLSIMNGLSYDGHSIFCIYNDDMEKSYPRYSSLDIIKFNTKFYEYTGISDYIILGKSSIDYIGYIKSNNKYVIMTNGTMDHIKEFNTFNEMITEFLKLS